MNIGNIIAAIKLFVCRVIY